MSPPSIVPLFSNVIVSLSVYIPILGVFTLDEEANFIVPLFTAVYVPAPVANIPVEFCPCKSITPVVAEFSIVLELYGLSNDIAITLLAADSILPSFTIPPPIAVLVPLPSALSGSTL